jgi:GDP-4-dehydro-6-deoxy-D-mannose reductase
VLVTGAEGFVGGHLLVALAEAGHEAVAARRRGIPAPDHAAQAMVLELEELDSVEDVAREPVDAVVHLAAIASASAARSDPGLAWAVNAAGTARLADAVARRRESGHDPLFLFVSTGEVYGAGPETPRVESDPVRPVSAYAASKAGAEIAVAETARRTGLRCIVARPFTHTGPGQHPRYVTPAFAARLREARATGARTVATGNLAPVRDLADVRDVARAYVALLERGRAGETYNVATGQGLPLADLFRKLASLIGIDAEPALDPALARAADIPYLVGDATRLRQDTGWAPTIPLERTLRELVDAQAH